MDREKGLTITIFIKYLYDVYCVWQLQIARAIITNTAIVISKVTNVNSVREYQ